MSGPEGTSSSEARRQGSPSSTRPRRPSSRRVSPGPRLRSSANGRGSRTERSSGISPQRATFSPRPWNTATRHSSLFSRLKRVQRAQLELPATVTTPARDLQKPQKTEKAGRGQVQQDDLEVAIQALWRLLSRPEMTATYELRLGARSDPALQKAAQQIGAILGAKRSTGLERVVSRPCDAAGLAGYLDARPGTAPGAARSRAYSRATAGRERRRSNWSRTLPARRFARASTRLEPRRRLAPTRADQSPRF